MTEGSLNTNHMYVYLLKELFWTSLRKTNDSVKLFPYKFSTFRAYLTFELRLTNVHIFLILSTQHHPLFHQLHWWWTTSWNNPPKNRRHWHKFLYLLEIMYSLAHLWLSFQECRKDLWLPTVHTSSPQPICSCGLRVLYWEIMMRKRIFTPLQSFFFLTY